MPAAEDIAVHALRRKCLEAVNKGCHEVSSAAVLYNAMRNVRLLLMI